MIKLSTRDIQKDIVSIHYPDPHHGWGIHLWSDDKDKVKKFRDIVLSQVLTDKSLQAFLQSDSSNYVYVELFNIKSEEEILPILNKIENQMKEVK